MARSRNNTTAKLPEVGPVGLRFVRRFRRQVLSGQLAPGTRLPSVRKLARIGGIGIHAANQALQRMESEGWARRQDGGYVLRVTDDAIEIAGAQLKHEPPVVVIVVSPLRIRSADANLMDALAEGVCEVFPGCSFRTVYVDLHAWLGPVRQLLEQDAGIPREIGFLLRGVPTEIKHFFAAADLPCVVVGYAEPDLQLPCVYQDMTEVGRMAGEILLPHGRVVVLCHEGLVGAEVKLLDGFRQAAAALGRPLPTPEGFYHHLPRKVDDYLGAVDRLLAGEGRPAGILAIRPEFALTVVKVAAARGIAVPGDLQVIGFPQHPMYRHIHPEITSIGVPSMAALGQRCAVMLAQTMGQRSEQRHEEVIPTVLANRGSTRP